MLHKIFARNRSGINYRKFYVILFLVVIVCLDKPINCLKSLNGLPANDFVEKCEQRCKDQVNHVWVKCTLHLKPQKIKNK